MFEGNKIIVPKSYRAYSWESSTAQSDSRTQTDEFLSDLTKYTNISTSTPYYFGHFIFNEKPNRTYEVIDGQQRITTIVIFLSALFARLGSIKILTEEEELFESMIKNRSKYIFSTVNHDNQLFREYVIDRIKLNKKRVETESVQRIVRAFDFFTKALAEKDETYLTGMLRTVSEASCTTFCVKSESGAIQVLNFINKPGNR